MRIAISIAGVSYEDGSKYRYRNYEDSVNEFNNNVIDYLKSQGNEVFTFIYTYQTDKCNDIINTYNEFTEAKFIDENNQFIPLGQTIQAVNIIAGLNEVLNWEFDYVIRARFDQKFLNNPFTTYDWDFDKVNFLWREPSHETLPLVNDTFFGFPYEWTRSIIESIKDSELNPHKGIRIALHNLHQPIIDRVGLENVKILDERFVTAEMNKLYKLTRHA